VALARLALVSPVEKLEYWSTKKMSIEISKETFKALVDPSSERHNPIEDTIHRSYELKGLHGEWMQVVENFGTGRSIVNYYLYDINA